MDFWAHETVTVQITHLDGSTPPTESYDPWDVQANSYGIFDTYWEVPEDALGETLQVNAEGQSSGLQATAIFTDANSVLLPSSIVGDTLCPGDSVEFCVTLYQPCSGDSLAPLPNRPILFFINVGNCGVNVGQDADDTVWTDENGLACFYGPLPYGNGEYALRAKYLGEPKPDEGAGDPPNSACDPGSYINISASNYCQDVILDSVACGGNPPTATCPGDTTIFLCTLSEVCISGFACIDPDDDLVSCSVSQGTLSGDQVCFTPAAPGPNTIRLIALDADGFADTCETVVTIVLNTAPVCSLPGDASYFVCDDTTFNFDVSATDVDDNLVGCSLTGGVGTLSGGVWSFTTSGPGVYSATFECIDSCGATCGGTVNITVGYNTAPVCNLP
ncbi:MAG: hypothetical protein JSV44_00830, partial [Candidatus Zixiibacteriota bacterium]